MSWLYARLQSLSVKTLSLSAEGEGGCKRGCLVLRGERPIRLSQFSKHERRNANSPTGGGWSYPAAPLFCFACPALPAARGALIKILGHLPSLYLILFLACTPSLHLPAPQFRVRERGPGPALYACCVSLAGAETASSCAGGKKREGEINVFPLLRPNPLRCLFRKQP